MARKIKATAQAEPTPTVDNTVATEPTVAPAPAPTPTAAPVVTVSLEDARATVQSYLDTCAARGNGKEGWPNVLINGVCKLRTMGDPALPDVILPVAVAAAVMEDFGAHDAWNAKIAGWTKSPWEAMRQRFAAKDYTLSAWHTFKPRVEKPAKPVTVKPPKPVKEAAVKAEDAPKPVKPPKAITPAERNAACAELGAALAPAFPPRRGSPNPRNTSPPPKAPKAPRPRPPRTPQPCPSNPSTRSLMGFSPPPCRRMTVSVQSLFVYAAQDMRGRADKSPPRTPFQPLCLAQRTVPYLLRGL